MSFNTGLSFEMHDWAAIVNHEVHQEFVANGGVLPLADDDVPGTPAAIVPEEGELATASEQSDGDYEDDL